MEKQTSKMWSIPLLKGIILILLAILIFMSPVGALLAWAIYIGIGFIIAGIALIYQGFSLRGVTEGWGWKVFEGIIDLFLGFILLANPALTASIFPFIIGFWGVVAGASVFISGLSEKEGRWIKILFGILIFLLASVIMFNPLGAALSIAVWIGILLLLAGIGNLIFAFQVKGLR